jgi:hypothetical protein
MKKEPDRSTKTNPPMSIRLPDDLREELTTASETLGESETTGARMSIRHGRKVLLQSFEKAEAA